MRARVAGKNRERARTNLPVKLLRLKIGAKNDGILIGEVREYMPLAAKKRCAVVEMHASVCTGRIAFAPPANDGNRIVRYMVVWVRVCGADVPLAMSRYFAMLGCMFCQNSAGSVQVILPY